MFLNSCEPTALKIILGINPLRKPFVPLDSSHRCFCSMYYRGTLLLLADTSLSAHQNRGKQNMLPCITPRQDITFFMYKVAQIKKKKRQPDVTRNRQICREISQAENIPRTKAPGTPERSTNNQDLCGLKISRI